MTGVRLLFIQAALLTQVYVIPGLLNQIRRYIAHLTKQSKKSAMAKIDRLAVGCFKLVCTSTGSKRVTIASTVTSTRGSAPSWKSILLP